MPSKEELKAKELLESAAGKAVALLEEAARIAATQVVSVNSITQMSGELTYMKKEADEFHVANKEEHVGITKRLDFTNGKIKGLEIWKATTAGAIVVIVFMLGYFINDYTKAHDQLTEIAKIQALNVLRLTELEKQ